MNSKGLAARLCALGVLAVFALLSGCGGDGSSTAAEAGDPVGSSSPATTAPEIDDADADDLKVIEAWSSTLSEGDVRGAAGYFATPSTAENGSVLVRIESLDDAIAFNSALPCGAEVISARTQGDFTTATFLLSDRPGGGCGSGVGSKASTSFQIEDGKIVEWRRIDAQRGAPGQAGGGESATI